MTTVITLQELEQAHFRHARHYLEQLRIANEMYHSGGEKLWQSLLWAQRDWDQIEQGQAWASQNVSDPQAAALCCDYPTAGAEVMLRHHTVSDRIAWLTAALAAAEALGRHRAQCAHLCALGLACWIAGEADRAVEYLERAIALAEQIDDPSGLAQAHLHLCEITGQQADYDRADRHGQVCLELYTRLNDRRGIAKALALLGTLRQYQEDFETAEQHLQESLAIFQALEDHPNTARALLRLGSLAGTQSRFAEAERYYVEGHALYQRLGDPEGQAQALRMLGTGATFEGDFAKARGWYQQSLALFERLGNRAGIAKAHMSLGEMDQYTDAGEQALAHYRSALAIFQAMDNPEDAARVLFRIANTAEDLGRLEEAERRAAEAVAIFREVGSHGMMASTLSLLGSFVMQREAYAEAEALFAEGLDAAEAVGDAWAVASINLNWCTLNRMRGLLDQVQPRFCRAFELFTSFQVVPMMLELVCQRAELLVLTGSLDQAYEFLTFVADHPSTLSGGKSRALELRDMIAPQLTEVAIQQARDRAQAHDLDAYIAQLRAECEQAAG